MSTISQQRFKTKFKKEAMELKGMTTENKTIDGFKLSHRRKYHQLKDVRRK